MTLDRRTFLRMSAAACVSLRLPHFKAADQQKPSSVRLALRPDRLGNRIESDFIGLSYESAQLANPNFFSEENTGLIALVKRLGNSGVLRIGGNTSEYCYWKPNSENKTSVSTDFVAAPDPGHKAAAPAYITPQAIRNLRDFLSATGWSLIYGLNMGTGTVEDAAAQAVYVMDTIGPNLIAFQLCNEPDLFYRNGIRNSDYEFPQFAMEWQRFHEAIRARVPNAPFAGPDTAFNTSWLVPFAQKFKDEIAFLSQHYYAEGPPTDPSMTIDRLLRPNPNRQEEFDGMKKTAQETGLPFRLAETNSCYSAGKPGVSDTFASALWGADLMYQLASAGGAGINFHGGGYGWYTPIAGTPEHGFLARPLYYGMLLFAQAGSGQLIDAQLNDPAQDPLLTTYALRTNAGEISAAIFNKNPDRAAQLSVNAAGKYATVLRLYAPRIDDTTDVTLGGSTAGPNGDWSASREERLTVHDGNVLLDLPAASATLLTFHA